MGEGNWTSGSASEYSLDGLSLETLRQEELTLNPIDLLELLIPAAGSADSACNHSSLKPEYQEENQEIVHSTTAPLPNPSLVPGVYVRAHKGCGFRARLLAKLKARVQRLAGSQ